MKFLPFTLLLLPAVARADRLITVPMSVKVPYQTLSFGTLYRTADQSLDGWLGYGLDPKIEVELWGTDRDPRNRKFSGGFSYQILPAFPDAAPGLAVGIQDVSAASRRGRVAFAAFTYRMTNLGERNQNVPTELTFGLWSYDKGLFYVGAKLPLTDELWLVGEHDAKELNWGASYEALPGTRVQFLFMNGRSTLGLVSRLAF